MSVSALASPFGRYLIIDVPFKTPLRDDIFLRPVLTRMGVRILITCMAF